MGAMTFTNTAKGETAQAAFNQAVQDAQWEHGHGGYSGTLAEKHEFVMLRPPAAELPIEGATWQDLADEALGLWGDEPVGPLLRHKGWDPEKRENITEELGTWPPAWEQFIREAHRAVDDKWGPAGCIQIGQDEWLFFGWASS